MAFKILAVFAVNLSVAIVTAGMLGDLCHEACKQTELQEQDCRKGCSPSGKDDGTVPDSCVEQCVGIGAPCRIFCGNNFHSCKPQCDLIPANSLGCLITCVQQNWAALQNSTAG